MNYLLLGLRPQMSHDAGFRLLSLTHSAQHVCQQYKIDSKNSNEKASAAANAQDYAQDRTTAWRNTAAARRHGRRRWKGSFESPRWRKFPFKRLAFLENLRYANIVYPSSSTLLYA